MAASDDLAARTAAARHQLEDLNAALAAVEHRAVPLADADELAALVASLRPEAGAHPLIRLGDAHDGGYLVPDDHDGIGSCFSPGVYTFASFEAALAARGVRTFMADASVDGPPFAHPLFDFEKRFLGDATGGDVIRLADWVAAKADAAETEMILQMDIEGAEYPVLLDTPAEVLRRFRILVIEFHRLGAIATAGALPFYCHLFGKLLRDFAVVHIHPNNAADVAEIGNGIVIPEIMEFTFHRRDRHRPTGRRPEYPHPCDAANLPGHPDPALPACWR